MTTIVHQMTGSLLREQGRKVLSSNGQDDRSGTVYTDTFVLPVDPASEEDLNLYQQIQVSIGGSYTFSNDPFDPEDDPGPVIPELANFDNYTVTVTIEITENV